MDSLDESLRSARLALGGTTLRLVDVLAAPGNEPSSAARAQLERDLSVELEERSPLHARAVDTTISATTVLGFESVAAWVTALDGRPLPPRVLAAERWLTCTDDATRDLVPFALKRVEPGLKSGQGRGHDLDRALRAPQHYEFFRQEDLFEAVTRWLLDLGLHPSANGRVTIDQERHPNRLPGARAFAFDVPTRVRLVLTRGPGLAVYEQWLGAWLTAIFHAHVTEGAPRVERSLGDQAVPDAFGLLASSLLSEEAWLKRYLRVPQATALEAARLAALRQTMALRTEAALAQVGLELGQRGAHQRIADSYVSHLGRALHVEPTRSRWLVDVDLRLPHLRALDSLELETALRQTLEERFNEDWWRNPAAGAWLTRFAAQGQRLDAPTRAHELGGTDAWLERAARRRIAVIAR
jgi:hypothetical protein